MIEFIRLISDTGISNLSIPGKKKFVVLRNFHMVHGLRFFKEYFAFEFLIPLLILRLTTSSRSANSAGLL